MLWKINDVFIYLQLTDVMAYLHIIIFYWPIYTERAFIRIHLNANVTFVNFFLGGGGVFQNISSGFTLIVIAQLGRTVRIADPLGLIQKKKISTSKLG